MLYCELLGRILMFFFCVCRGGIGYFRYEIDHSCKYHAVSIGKWSIALLTEYRLILIGLYLPKQCPPPTHTPRQTDFA